jgi:hypothetical protein
MIEHEIPVERVQEFDVFIIRPGEGLLQPIKSPNPTKRLLVVPSANY